MTDALRPASRHERRRMRRDRQRRDRRRELVIAADRERLVADLLALTDADLRRLKPRDWWRLGRELRKSGVQ